MNRAANFFSALFHPVFMPTVGMFIILNYTDSLEITNMNPMIKKFLTIITALFTLILPLLTVLLMRWFNMAESIKLTHRKERNLPLIFSALYFLFAYVFLVKRLPLLPSIFHFITLGGVFTLTTAFLINLRFQISIHTMSIGALIATLTAAAAYFEADLKIYIMIGILIAGIIAFARLQLNAHKPYQIYSGFLSGFFVQFFTIYIMLWIQQLRMG